MKPRLARANSAVDQPVTKNCTLHMLDLPASHRVCSVAHCTHSSASSAIADPSASRHARKDGGIKVWLTRCPSSPMFATMGCSAAIPPKVAPPRASTP
eukprot:scaffold56151_cov17-Tisochrysis_lutea.AAC.1